MIRYLLPLVIVVATRAPLPAAEIQLRDQELKTRLGVGYAAD
jgi:hypothetical protein